VYLSSADLMPRNLDRRVEVMFPVQDEENRDTLIEFLHLGFNDNQKSWRLQPDGTYRKTEPGENEAPCNCQQIMMEKAEARAERLRRHQTAVLRPKGPGAAPGL